MSETEITVNETIPTDTPKASVGAAVEDREKPRVKEAVSLKELFKNRLFISVLILGLALTVILLLLFAPLSYSRANSYDYDVDVKYNGIDVFQLVSCAVMSMSDSEISSTRLYNETVNQYRELAENLLPYAELTRYQEAELSEITENSLFITLASKDVTLRFQTAAALLTLVLVLIVAFIMFCYSLRSVIGLASGKMNDERRPSPIFVNQIRLLWGLVMLLPLLAHNFYSMSNWGISSELSSFSSGGCGLSFGMALVAVFTAFVAFCSVVHLVLTNIRKLSLMREVNTKKVALLICVFITVLSLFLPLVNVTFFKTSGTVVNRENVSLTVSDLYVMNGDDVGYYRSTSKAQNRELVSEISRKVLRYGDAGELADRNLINLLVMGIARNDISDFYLFLQIAVFAVNFFAILLAVAILNSLLFRIDVTKKIKKLKVFLALLALTYAALSICVMVVSGDMLDADLLKSVSIGVACGPIVTIVSALLLVAIKIEPRPKSLYADGWYDNADVSYAPYVIKVAKKR